MITITIAVFLAQDEVSQSNNALYRKVAYFDN